MLRIFVTITTFSFDSIFVLTIHFTQATRRTVNYNEGHQQEEKNPAQSVNQRTLNNREQLFYEGLKIH